MRLYRLLMMTALLLAAACGGTGGSSSQSGAASSPAAKPLKIQMLSLAASGVSGTAEVTRKGDSAFTVVVHLIGMAPNSVHVSHIHKTTCEKGGGIAYALSTLTAGRDGSATATTTINVPFQVPADGWYVNVHTGPDLNGANAKSISCGNLPAGSGAGGGGSPSSSGYGGY
jgi:hypothetical protein